MKKKKMFDCPSCGNPLRCSDKKVMTCHWCKRAIIPRGYKHHQKEEVFEKEYDFER